MRDWLAARTAATPRHEALVCGDERLTFAQLNDLVACECARWQAAGHQARSAHRACHAQPAGNGAATLRVHALRYCTGAAGRAPRLPRKARKQLEQAACDWLLPETDNDPFWRLAPDGQRNAIEPSVEFTPGQIAQQRDGQFQPDAPLAIVHTSGTTGQPKGSHPQRQQFFLQRAGRDHAPGSLAAGSLALCDAAVARGRAGPADPCPAAGRASRAAARI